MLSTHLPALLFFAFVLIFARNASPSVAQGFEPSIQIRAGDSSTPSRFVADVFGAPNSAYAKAIKRALNSTARVWESKIQVRVRVQFKDFRGSTANATSHPHFLVANRNKSIQQLVQIPAMEAIVHEERNQDGNDVDITVNTKTNWHLGDNDPPADKLDLSTIIMQEVYHNLIFSGRIIVRKNADKTNTAQLDGGIPSRFDKFLVNKEGCSVLGYLTDEKLQRRLGVSGGELLAAALTNEELYVRSKKPPLNLRIHAPRRFDKRNSVYHTRPTVGGAPTLMEANFPLGKRVLDLSPELRALQRAYLNRDVPGGTVCAFMHANPYPRGTKHNSKAKRRKIGGMPTWAFGLCMVLLVIVLTILLFGICTIGAVAKQKAKPSFWKRLTCCCTGVDDAPDKPVFMFIDENTAKKAQSARNSLEAARAANGADSAASFPREPVAERSREHSLLSATAETQLPARFHK